jgi:DNA-binding winged helix-turn-helix (wHTH) protein
MLNRQERQVDMDMSNPSSEAAQEARPAAADAIVGDDALRFRSFTVHPGSRLLLRDGKPVSIGGRAFDLLVILLRSRGQVVTKQEITRYVWPAVFIEESNLRFQVGCLRRALGRDADLIKSIAGRGYLFVADHAQREPRVVQNPPYALDDGTQYELLEGFLRSAGALVSSYGSLEAFLGALATHRRQSPTEGFSRP